MISTSVAQLIDTNVLVYRVDARFPAKQENSDKRPRGRRNLRSSFEYAERRADSRIRTDDLIITNDLLYQLSYIGILSLFRFQEQDSSTRELKDSRILE